MIGSTTQCTWQECPEKAEWTHRNKGSGRDVYQCPHGHLNVLNERKGV